MNTNILFAGEKTGMRSVFAARLKQTLLHFLNYGERPGERIMKRRSIFALVLSTILSFSALASAQEIIPSFQLRLDNEIYPMTQSDPQSEPQTWTAVFYLNEEEAERNEGVQANIDFQIGDLTGGTSWSYCYYLEENVSVPETGLITEKGEINQVPFRLSADDQIPGRYKAVLNASSGAIDFTYLDEGTLGDVNLDGVVDIVDSLLISQDYVHTPITSTYETDLADVNCDGSVNIVDSLLIAQAYVQVQSAIDTIAECAAN
jgi:hypothetical protein